MKTVILLLATCFIQAAYAQDKGLFYEISGNGLAQPSFIFGTFHLLCPEDLQIADATRKALDDSEQFYAEIDLDDPSIMMRMVMGMMLPDGKNMRDLLSTEDYSVLDGHLRGTLGSGLAQMGTLKPLALMSLMSAGMLNCQAASLDLTLAQLAGQDGMEVLGLETLEEQMAAFDTTPLDQQLKDLVEMARKPDETREELAELLAAYKSQDIAQMMKLIRESEIDDGGAFQTELLDKRNANWIPLIENAARDKATFFAFGAGHLGGEKGVISLLRTKGYTVKPLP